MRMRLVPLLAVLAIAPILLAGCGSENRTVLGPESAETAAAMKSTAVGAPDAAQEMHGSYRGGWSRAMFVHASPDAPGVDILLDERKVARNLVFPLNTPYRYVRPGDHRVRVNVAGTSTTVIDAELPFARKQNYSIFAINQVANIEPLVLEDDLSRPASGKAHVRFIHLSPDAPAVDVAVKDGPVVFGNKAFKEYTPFTPLPAGTYDLEVRVAGTSTVALALPDVRFKQGRIYTVFAKGFLSGTGAQALGAQIIINKDKNQWDRDDRDDDDDRERDDDDRARATASR